MLYKIQIDKSPFSGIDNDWHVVGGTDSKWAAMRLAEKIHEVVNDKDNDLVFFCGMAVRVIETEMPTNRSSVGFIPAKENANDKIRIENI